MQNKKVVSAGAIVAIVALAAGCGSSSKSSSSTSTSAATTATSGSGTSATTGGSTSQALPSLKGQTVSVLGQWTGAEETAFEAVIADFDKQTGATVNYTPSSNETTVLGTEVAGGTPPNIAIVSLPGQIAQFAEAGKLIAQPSATQSAVAANYASVWSGLGSYKGTLYGVPVDASDKTTMWYNATAFQNAGITDPSTTLGSSWTWQQFLTDLGTLGSSGVQTPFTIGAGDGWPLTDLFENIYLQTAGVTKYNELTHLQIPWTDPSVTTALTDMNQLLSNTALVGSPAAALKISFDDSVDDTFKASPTSAVVYEASFVATTITTDKDPAVVGKTALVAPFPSLAGPGKGALEAAGDFAVNFSSSPASLAFSQFLASPKAAEDLISAEGSGFMSPNKNVPNSDYPDSTLQALDKDIISAGNNLVFDMSDQAPAAFGGTTGQGEYLDFQNFYSSHNIQTFEQTAQSQAATAYGCSTVCASS